MASIFDQFQSGPSRQLYQRAPIGEALTVVQSLNKAAEKNLADYNKIQLMAANVPAALQSDKQYKDQYVAGLQQQLEDIAAAPEYASSKVRQAATQFATDPKLAAIKATTEKLNKFNETYKADPSKYGDVPTWQLKKAMDAYNEAGGAASGATLNVPSLYEQIDENKWMRENGKAIAASQEGWAFDNGKFIEKGTLEVIDPERVRAVLKNAALSDNKMSRQLQLENEMYNDINGTSLTLDQFVDAKTGIYGDMFGYSKSTKDLKSKGRGSSKGTGFSIGANMFDYKGQDVSFDMTEDRFLNAPTFFDNLKKLESSDDPRDVQRAMALRANYKNAVREMVSAEGMDPIVEEFLLQADLDDLPIEKKVWKGRSFKDDIDIYEYEMDFSAFEKFATERGFDAGQLDRYKQEIGRGLNTSMWQTDIGNTWNASNTLTMDTQFTNVSASLDLNERDTKRMNQMFAGSLASKDMIQVVNEDGEVEEMSGSDFRGDFDVNSVKIISIDTNGTGAMNVQIKNDDGEVENKMIIANPQEDQVFRVMSNGFSMAANNPNATSQQQVEAARKGLNLVMPQITRSAEMIQSDNYKPGDVVPIFFGAYNNIVNSKFGAVTLEMDADGDYIAKSNGTNLFANSEDFTNLAKDATSPQQMAVLINQYVRQNL